MNDNTGIIRKYHVLLFYRFIKIDDLQTYKDQLIEVLEPFNLKGRILLAPEGVNGTLAGWNDSYIDIIEALETFDPRLKHTDWKSSVGEGIDLPFIDLFIKPTKELIGTALLGKDIFDKLEFSESTYGGLSELSTGVHLPPHEFHTKLHTNIDNTNNTYNTQQIGSNDHKIILLDVRNDIEYQVGHFTNAINLQTNYYSESWSKIDDIIDTNKSDIDSHNTTIMMYCTGNYAYIYTTFTNIYQYLTYILIFISYILYTVYYNMMYNIYNIQGV